VLLPKLRLLYVIYFTLLALIAIQTFLSINVYGGLPIVSYLLGDGNIQVGDANRLQVQSGYGQFGLLQISLSASHGLLLLICVYANAQRNMLPLAVVFPVPLILFAHVLNAKRQGIVMFVVFLIVGSILVTGKPLRFLTSLVRLGGARWITWMLMVGIVPILLGFAGFLATIRTQGQFRTTGVEQYVSYLQYPLLNLELQAQKVAYGPSSFEPLGPMVTLIPYKSRPPEWQMPPKAEMSAPASILEHFHWFWGIWGVAGFMFLLGFIVQFLYQRSHSSVFCLLGYCQIAHALFVAHSSNLILTLAYVPIPLLIFAGVSLLFGTRNRDYVVTDAPFLAASGLSPKRVGIPPRAGMDPTPQ
jgi:oligosaccharide repeat unit polymerase